MSLLEDIDQAVIETERKQDCPLCVYIRDQDDIYVKDALARAAAGRIGRDKLVAILQKLETGIGKRTVTRHRQEGHTP
jgi:hypothetical protein